MVEQIRTQQDTQTAPNTATDNQIAPTISASVFPLDVACSASVADSPFVLFVSFVVSRLRSIGLPATMSLAGFGLDSGFPSDLAAQNSRSDTHIVGAIGV